MRLEALLAMLLLLAGCGGFAGGPPAASPMPEEPVRYGVAAQSDYADERTFTIRVRADETTLLNRSNRLAGGERWHAVNLSSENYGEREYELQPLVDGAARSTATFGFREAGTVERRSAATPLVQGPSSGETHVCGGTVSCYEAVA